MLPQVHFIQNDERNIILHTHVHSVINGIELDIVRVAVVRSVYGVVQRQCPLFVLRVSKDKFKNPVFVFTIYFSQLYLSFFALSCPEPCREKKIWLIVIITNFNDTFYEKFMNHWQYKKKVAAEKTAQKRSRLLFYGLICLRLRNSGLRPSDSLDAAGLFRLIKLRKRSL